MGMGGSHGRIESIYFDYKIMKISSFYFGPGSPKNRFLQFFQIFYEKMGWNTESRVRRRKPGITSETTETRDPRVRRRFREPRVRRRFRESRVRRRCLSLTSETTETRDPDSGERSAPIAALSAAIGALRGGQSWPKSQKLALDAEPEARPHEERRNEREVLGPDSTSPALGVRSRSLPLARVSVVSLLDPGCPSSHS